MDSNEAPPRERAVPRGGIRAHVLARLQRLIEERLTEPLRVEELAREACLSPFHFSRMFKQATGMAPHAYLVARRLERARKMLAETTLPLTDIARRSGFSTQAHFCNVFRAHTGITPNAFRRQHQARQTGQPVGAIGTPFEKEPS